MRLYSERDERVYFGIHRRIPQTHSEGPGTAGAKGEQFKINLFAGASTGESVDGILAEAGLVAWRRPYMSNRTMRNQINADEIQFKDDHLSRLSGQVRDGGWGGSTWR